MTVRSILKWPDPRLTMSCDPVGADISSIATLAEDLLETMYAAKGRGLAAPQIGVLMRVFVMDSAWKDGKPAPSVCIDPRILESSEEQAVMQEGCLSIPGVVTEIDRPVSIRLAWTTLEGERVIARLDGSKARIAQHEIDHLDGIVTFDRLDAKARSRAEADYAGVS